VVKNAEALTYPLKIDNPSSVYGTGVGMLFSAGGEGGSNLSTDRGKGALVYEYTSTWNRGDFHFLQDSGANSSNPNLSDSVMTVRNNGNVGIGTTAPKTKLEVASMTRITGVAWPSTGEGLELGYNAALNRGYVQSYDRDSNEWGELYFGDGTLGIGVGSLSATSNAKLKVAGNVKVSGAGNGIVFPDGTVQTTAAAPTWHQILPAAERFVLVMGGEAVLDKETGLVWEQSPDTEERNWWVSFQHCFYKEVGNRMGWRAPTIEELASLLDKTQNDPALPSGHPFDSVQNSVLAKYWSFTTSIYSDRAFHVTFGGPGYVGVNDKTVEGYVWCVRGGHGHDGY
jgi:hypothetical protein